MRHSWSGVVAAILVAVGIWYVHAGEKSESAKPRARDGDADLVKRGEYLVNEVAHCSHCHTPRGEKGQLEIVLAGRKAIQSVRSVGTCPLRLAERRSHAR